MKISFDKPDKNLRNKRYEYDSVDQIKIEDDDGSFIIISSFNQKFCGGPTGFILLPDGVTVERPSYYRGLFIKGKKEQAK